MLYLSDAIMWSIPLYIQKSISHYSKVMVIKALEWSVLGSTHPAIADHCSLSRAQLQNLSTEQLLTADKIHFQRVELLFKCIFIHALQHNNKSLFSVSAILIAFVGSQMIEEFELYDPIGMLKDVFPIPARLKQNLSDALTWSMMYVMCELLRYSQNHWSPASEESLQFSNINISARGPSCQICTRVKMRLINL